MQATRAGRFHEFVRLRPHRGNVSRLIRLGPNSRKIGVIPFMALLIAWLWLSCIYSLSPIQVLKQGVRVVATPVYSFIYRDDTSYVEETTRRYRVGTLRLLGSSAVDSWKRVEQTVPGFRCIQAPQSQKDPAIPFVYERTDAEYLRRFRSKCRLDEIVKGAPDEYDAMLRLGGWLGARWDHGTDKLPGDTLFWDPSAVVNAGEHGAKFWCEIAARTTVQAATALGWPARLVTASRDGYTWEHAVAELWSNQFGKWFVIDTDFNVVYESAGVPLSAFELSHQGERLQRRGRLSVRAVAPPKASLPFKDLIPFYAYVHVDMRNDWCSRPLRPGSPAGGDLAVWWTARPALAFILTGKTRVDDPNIFDWRVNSVSIYALTARRLREDRLSLQIGLTGYSPMFEAFEVSLDGQAWKRIDGANHSLDLVKGAHTIAARLVTGAGYPGPKSEIKFELMSAARVANAAADLPYRLASEN